MSSTATIVSGGSNAMTDVAPDCALEVCTLSDTGRTREANEDSAGSLVEGPECAVVAVADGVSGSEGGEVASQMAIEVTFRAYREEAAGLPAGQRLYRSVQQANIEIHDRALVVPELRGMSTTLTAVAVDRGELTVVHVGDSRLYLLRDGGIVQLTKDHTVAAEKSRMGLLSKERARVHPDRCALTRSVGRELIVSRDRASHRLRQGDALLLCSDGLHTVLEDQEMARLAAGLDAASACRALVDAANERGTPDNLTAGVLRVVGEVPAAEPPGGLAGTLRRFFRRP